VNPQPTVEVKRIRLRKGSLDALLPEEQQLVAAALVVKNDISILLCCALMALPRSSDSTDPVYKARSSQTLFLLLLLAGKLYEAWVLLEKALRGRPHFERMRSRLDGPGRRALRQLEKYFANESSLILRTRNDLAFHYSPKVLAKAWNRLPDAAVLELWMRDRDAACRFSLGAAIAHAEIERVFATKSRGIEKPGAWIFLDDVRQVCRWFNKLFGGVLACLLPAGFDQEIETVSVAAGSDPGLPAFPAMSELTPAYNKPGSHPE
jgi:hypothetical protein